MEVKLKSNDNQEISPKSAGGASFSNRASNKSLLVNFTQRGNPALKAITNVSWEYGETDADYEMGVNMCALFLSLRYHSLNQDYIHSRMKKLGNKYELRVLLVQVDVKDPHHHIKNLTRICILADMTLVLAWSPEEAGKILETYKIYENKPADNLMEKSESLPYLVLVQALSSIKPVNKTDAMTLISKFKTLEGILNATEYQLSECPGFGSRKAKKLYATLHEQFCRFLYGPMHKILQRIRVPNNSRRYISLYQRLLFKKELSVSTFCNITIDVPFSINLEPLDVHKYPNCDKIFIKLNNFDSNLSSEPLICAQELNNIYIKDAISKDMCFDSSCTVIAPIKANLNVHSEYGDIKIRNFNGDKIIVTSESGNVAVNGYQGKEINIQTSRGNVELGGVIQSSSIIVLISEDGSVRANKLLGEKTNISTKLGNIFVNSSYCNNSKFLIEQGDMNLKNIHKHCEVVNKKSGNINISSLDGQLNVIQTNGNADIHLSRITENSNINLLNGHLLLRLSDECQETTHFKIKSKSTNIHKNVNIKQVHPVVGMDNFKTVHLNCENCSVDIEASSWFDMNFRRK